MTTIEKKETTATTTSLGRIPKPSQNTSTGAKTGTGTACEATIRGRVARRSVGEKWIAIASRHPNTVATRIPSRTSWAVTRKLLHSSARSVYSALATAWGGGRISENVGPLRST